MFILNTKMCPLSFVKVKVYLMWQAIFHLQSKIGTWKNNRSYILILIYFIITAYTTYNGIVKNIK